MGRKRKSFRELSSPLKPKHVSNRPSKRRSWKNKAMLGAMEAMT